MYSDGKWRFRLRQWHEGIICQRTSGKLHYELTEEITEGGKSTVSASHLCLPCQNMEESYIYAPNVASKADQTSSTMYMYMYACMSTIHEVQFSWSYSQ